MGLQQRDGWPSAPREQVTREDPRRLRADGGLSCQAPPFLPTGNRGKYQQKGCAPSCEEVSRILQQLSQISGPGNLGLLGLAKLEVQGVRCCERDLCNGGTLPLGPGGGLLLSLGLIFLWALL